MQAHDDARERDGRLNSRTEFWKLYKSNKVRACIVQAEQIHCEHSNQPWL